MNISQACQILSNIQQRDNIGLLELVVEYQNSLNEENNYNDNYGIVENQAFRVFINQAQQFFAPAEV
jgi:hypothetical protein